MRVRTGFGLLLGIMMSAVVVDAQFGGLIKRGIEKAVPGEAAKPAPPPAEPEKAESGLGFTVDDGAMDRLLTGLETERAARAAALKVAMSARSQTQYNTCQAELALNPEVQKLFEGLAALPDDATPEQLQAATTKMATDMSALLEKTCGPTRAETREAVDRQMADAGRLGAAAAKMADEYARVQEHAYRFCQLPPAEQAAAQNEGLRVPGTGQGVYWVFTATEAKAYAPRCAELLSLTAALEKQSLELEAFHQN